MARITQPCPICTKPLEETSRLTVGTKVLISYKCGHAFMNDALNIHSEPAKLEFTALDTSGHEAWDYQKTGVQFILDGGFNVLLADQMRLGKTPQALLALRNRYSKFKKVLICVKSANMVNWIREYKKWTDPMPLGIYPILGSKSFIPPGFHTYIISHDLISNPGTCKSCKHRMHEHGECTRCRKSGDKSGCAHPIQSPDKMVDKLLMMGFDLVIVDEFHNFKNTDSKRSQAFNHFLRQINISEVNYEVKFHCMQNNCGTEWTEEVKLRINSDDAQKSVTKTSHCPKCFAQQTQSSVTHLKTERLCPCLTLTGTPIENLAEEYFPTLNVVAPTLFPSPAAFKKNWLTIDGRGKYSRIASWKLEAFRKATAPYILRREWDDVYKSRPKFTKNFEVIELVDETFKEMYNKQLDKIEAMIDERGGKFDYFSTIGELTVLRQICGLAKTKWVADFLHEAAESNDGHLRKYAVGMHHHGVRDQLNAFCKDLGVINLSGKDSPFQKDFVMKSFEHDKNMVLCINMLAGGEGMDFCYVPEVIVLEREWRSTREDQFEARFYNPNANLMASRGYANKITNCLYVLCDKTVDSFFHELTRAKAMIVGETVENNWDMEQDPMSYSELVKQTLGSRL